MDILEVNRNTLANLYEQYPENFKDLSLDGNDLVYNGERIDISNFNINDLLSGESMFTTSLSVLSSEDIFRIIRLHALTINSELKKDNNKSETERKMEEIKRDNPLMKNVSIVRRSNGIGEDEYINIVDSLGEDHLYRNDRNVNFFSIYEELKLRNNGNVTPEDVIDEINRKLYDVSLDDSRDILSNSQTTEDFANKMTQTSNPYKDDNNHRVLGSEKDNVAIVTDEFNPDKHQVVTYKENEYGDLIMESHNQNVSGVDTVIGNNGDVQSTDTAVVNDINSDNMAIDKPEEEVVATLISSREFYELLNSNLDLTSEQRKDVDLYYAYLGDLILYEDYLLPELRQILEQFRGYVFELEYGDNEREINAKQQEAIDRNHKMEEQKNLGETENLKKVEDKVKKLVLTRPKDDENQGSISVLQVVAIVVGIAIILTAVTLYLIS